MLVRRIVTGNTPGLPLVAVAVADDEVQRFPIGDLGFATMLLWGRDDSAEFPDDGSQHMITINSSVPGLRRMPTATIRDSTALRPSIMRSCSKARSV
jgi:hypothetical protein